MSKLKFLQPYEMTDLSISTPVGSPEFPEFEINEKDELVPTGKKKNIQAEIESYKDSVLLSKILERCLVTGESLEAPSECYGDTRIIPKSLLDVHDKKSKVDNFVNSLSDSDLSLLNQLGFDEFIKSKIDSAAKPNNDTTTSNKEEGNE